MTQPTLRIISLGAGVQSTTMALMAARGDAGPMPDCAIFADTGWEPRATYEHLDRLEKMLPFPVHRVSAGNIHDDLLARSSARSGRFANVPFFLKQVAANGAVRDGIGRRQCTSHYKIEPIQVKVRQLLGVGPRARIKPGAVEQWIGISLDEIERATPSRVRYVAKRFPLLEARMRRHDCVRWLEERQLAVPPKSACIGCPYHSNAHWREMRDNAPDEFAQAVEVDRAIRTPLDRHGYAKIRAEQFVHRKLVPLDQADLSSAEDRGQINMFGNECDGMCGT